MSGQLGLFGPGIALGRPEKPALRFYGGKWSLAGWIVDHFPRGFERMHYVEPFGGSAAVLLSKPRSVLETYNDLDSRLVTFFRVLRTREEELVRALELTPFAREEYRESDFPAGDDLETARRFFVSLWQSVGGKNGIHSGWRPLRALGGRYTTPARDYAQAIENLFGVSQRFREVQIENLPALELIRKTDSVETLFYVDPPYPLETRGSKGRSYAHEMTVDDHVRLREGLAGVLGFVVLSSYRSRLYDDLFSDWVRVDRDAKTMSGGSAVESLYLNPRLAAELGVSPNFATGGNSEVQ